MEEIDQKPVKKKVVKKTVSKLPPPPKRPVRKTPPVQKNGGLGKFITIIAGAIIGVIIILGLIFGYHHYTQNRALAEYRGGKVTRDEFITEIRLQAGKYDPLVWKDEKQALKIKREILNEILKEHILLAKAHLLGIKVTEDELKTELDSFKSGYSEDSFRKMLASKGIKYKDWADKKLKKRLIQKLVEQEVIKKIAIDDAALKEYYKDHKEDFTHPLQVRARHIMVSDWNEAQKISEELAAGANFAATAKQKSISPERWKGGDLGYFSKGSHPKIFDVVCFGTPVGDTSQVVKSEYGYHIFKIIDKRGPVKESPEEAKKFIATELKKQRSVAAFDTWFTPIMEAAQIKIHDDHLKMIEVNIDDAENKND